MEKPEHSGQGLLVNDYADYEGYINEFKETFGARTEDVSKKRTLTQNAALHLWFRQLADELVERKVDVRAFYKKPIYFNEKLVKMLIWQDVMKIMTGKTHTSDLTTSEVSEVWEVLNKHLGETQGIHIPFPEHDWT